MTAEGPGKRAEEAARTLLRAALERDGSRCGNGDRSSVVERVSRDQVMGVVVGVERSKRLGLQSDHRGMRWAWRLARRAVDALTSVSWRLGARSTRG